MKMILLVTLLSALTACKRKAGDADASVAVKVTGGICTPLLAGGHLTGEVVCINGGNRYLCVVAGERAECTITNYTTPEKP